MPHAGKLRSTLVADCGSNLKIAPAVAQVVLYFKLSPPYPGKGHGLRADSGITDHRQFPRIGPPDNGRTEGDIKAAGSSYGESCRTVSTGGGKRSTRWSDRGDP